MKESDEKEMMLNAVEIAKSIIAGDTDPNAGCSKLGEINRDLDWPKELSAFGLLSHEQYDHENIGITAEACIQEIIDECKKLVANYS
ncbi:MULTISPECIES: hypothetical protein [unclassified Shewanella]|uniref:hypothetical protein n=1 Tax=unclassified Shewanella TaxID=196818 RepID=UPI00200389EB|nr:MULTISPECIES: hypothetical protein [unclassified Shewanella]MCK7633212.1 hypothetical protein [Shewanella sp. JNE17]MCK7648437.1 hypothetical protein [Shewanella sp. JNE8]MCK7656518.1 hypothetical protein [Shewanella sp. JNE4-2]UPO29555.1 hypothetical protein MZ182_10840 [Shewanella sp. JNE2]